jgi:hypothetical protein
MSPSGAAGASHGQSENSGAVTGSLVEETVGSKFPLRCVCENISLRDLRIGTQVDPGEVQVFAIRANHDRIGAECVDAIDTVRHRHLHGIATADPHGKQSRG